MQALTWVNVVVLVPWRTSVEERAELCRTALCANETLLGVCASWGYEQPRYGNLLQLALGGLHLTGGACVAEHSNQGGKSIQLFPDGCEIPSSPSLLSHLSFSSNDLNSTRTKVSSLNKLSHLRTDLKPHTKMHSLQKGNRTTDLWQWDSFLPLLCKMLRY